MKEVYEILQRAIDDGYRFVLESKDELVFFKKTHPELSRQGYWAGAIIWTYTAKQIVEHGLWMGLPIRYSENDE